MFINVKALSTNVNLIGPEIRINCCKQRHWFSLRLKKVIMSSHLLENQTDRLLACTLKLILLKGFFFYFYGGCNWSTLKFILQK